MLRGKEGPKKAINYVRTIYSPVLKFPRFSYFFNLLLRIGQIFSILSPGAGASVECLKARKCKSKILVKLFKGDVWNCLNYIKLRYHVNEIHRNQLLLPTNCPKFFLRNTNEKSGSDTMESTVCGRYWVFFRYIVKISHSWMTLLYLKLFQRQQSITESASKWKGSCRETQLFPGESF